ncbi:Peptidoglycan binding domain protein [Ketogulonicigenium robustum]|uniref:Peptidoglycan binding domain protein n=1 Tax=Ketogulonicigenium robustum TaxID=92947 RepID=A0A1W6P0P8_9RHOB|nr:peptidoglycan-binding domain-containing protein [Ketogulonicigenium robustum]ARO15014.1 Peptidoglycan binding domain protein [Ketogulonicigenium robustum]
MPPLRATSPDLSRLWRKLALSIILCAAALLAAHRDAAAQDGPAWVQIEAQPTLAMAQQRVRAYSGGLPDVSGWTLPSGWYAIVLGPYTRSDATAYLAQLLRDRAAPNDSYIVDGSQFRQQFWPIGSGADLTPRPLPAASAVVAPPPAVEPPVETDPAETVETALASENLLDRAAKQAIQSALADAGVYSGAIDGLFGRGTRDAMTAWQTQRGSAPTGVLTSAERDALITDYNAILAPLGLTLTRDTAAGIEIEIPTAVVAARDATPPFALWQATDSPAAVLLISQSGDSARLASLAAELGALPVVPAGARVQRSGPSLLIEGADAQRRIHLQATARDGVIKGFALVWPTGDDRVFGRLLARMQASYRVLPGTLDHGATSNSTTPPVDTTIDTPRVLQAGVYVNAQGEVATAAAPLAQCTRFVLGGDRPATLRRAAGGVAIVAPATPSAPAAVARFAAPAAGDTAAVVAGFSAGTVLAQASTTPARAQMLAQTDTTATQLRISAQTGSGDIGGPVLDGAGSVIGLLVPTSDNASGAASAVSATTVAAFAGAALDAGPHPAIAAGAVAQIARAITVQVACW